MILTAYRKYSVKFEVKPPKNFRLFEQNEILSWFNLNGVFLKFKWQTRNLDKVS